MASSVYRADFAVARVVRKRPRRTWQVIVVREASRRGRSDSGVEGRGDGKDNSGEVGCTAVGADRGCAVVGVAGARAVASTGAGSRSTETGEADRNGRGASIYLAGGGVILLVRARGESDLAGGCLDRGGQE